jgi:hypothetical protein
MFDAHLAPAPARAPHDPRIARAEERLDMLRELAELGMSLARELTRRTLGAPEPVADPDPPAAAAAAAAAAARGDGDFSFAARGRPEPRDPAESFARISRAVRLTLALEARAEADLAALRAGEPASAPESGAAAPRDYPSAHRNRVRDCVSDVIDREITEPRLAQDMLDALHERLTEGERYDAFIHQPLRDSVAAICEDLGLHPDWSRWTGEGWPPPADPSRPGTIWRGFWGPTRHTAPTIRQE